MTELQLSQPDIVAPRLTPYLALRDFNAVTKRNLLRAIRTPQLLLFTLVQPITLLILFRYIFVGAVKSPAGGYVNFLVPAIFIETVLVGSMTSAIGIAEDLKSGMVDRFRSLPMARSAVLVGRSLTDLIKNVVALAVMVGLGVATGFRFHSHAGPILLGMLLILAIGYSFCWMNAAIGISVKDPEAATSAGTGPTFLLLFASNAFVPTSTLPGWLQPFARDQPLSVNVSAVRALFEGGAAQYVWQSLAWSAGITVVFFLMSVNLYQKATAQ
jgi:ABC transporter DrrB family efflux protein